MCAEERLILVNREVGNATAEIKLPQSQPTPPYPIRGATSLPAGSGSQGSPVNAVQMMRSRPCSGVFVVIGIVPLQIGISVY